MHPLFYVTDNLEPLLVAGRVTLIFDALDEMPQDSYQERYQSLKEFMVLWESFGNRFIFSCRLLDYDPAFNVAEIVIDRFDRGRIKSFLQKHAPHIAGELYRKILDDDALEDLVSNPFLLQALAYINLPDPEDYAYSNQLWIPATRGELLRVFVERLLTREAGIKQKKYLDSIDGGLVRLRSFLARLAFEIQGRREGRTSARVESLTQVWNTELKLKELLWIARRARILGKRGQWSHELADATPPNIEPPDRVEFVHHRLQEMFAAEELAHRLSNGEAVNQYLEDIWWQETVVFAVGMVDEPHVIIKQILAPRPDANVWVNDVLTKYGGPLIKEEEVADTSYIPSADQDGRET
jgi:predicted NACHT family NTPase